MIKNITKNLMPVLATGAGAVGSSYIASKIPVGDDKLKAGLLIVAGLLLSGKKGMVGNLGTGVAVGGVVKMAQSFGIGAIPDPIMELDEIDVEDLSGLPDPIMGTEYEEEVEQY